MKRYNVKIITEIDDIHAKNEEEAMDHALEVFHENQDYSEVILDLIDEYDENKEDY